MKHPERLLALSLILLSSCADAVAPGWGVLAYPVTIVMRAERERSYRGDTVVESDRVTAYFRSADDKHSLPVREFGFNGVEIPKQGGDTNYYSLERPAGELPLFLDGRRHYFHVIGTTQIPSFIDSVRSPANPTHILFPTASDTVSLAGGLVIRWTPSSDPGQTSVSYGLRQGIASMITCCNSDDGSDTIDRSLLASTSFGPGPVTLSLSRFTRRDTLTAEKQRYTITIVSTETITTHLKE